MWKSFTRINNTKIFSNFVGKDIEVGGSVKYLTRVKNAPKTKGAIEPVIGNPVTRHFSSSFKGGCVLKPGLYTNNCRSVFRRELLDQNQRLIHTSPRKDALPAYVVVVLGRIAKMGAVLIGRTVRRWWQKLPPEEKAIYKARIRKNRILAGLFGASALGMLVYYDRHVHETPLTNRKRFLAFTTAQIFDLAKIELAILLKSNEKQIIPADFKNIVYQRTIKVAQRLLNANRDLPQIHELEWTVTVVNDDSQTNAFVLPCGSIFVFSGLLKLCDSDDQLGIILGHEMAHAVMGHGAEKASFMHFMDLLVVVPLAALWTILPSDLTAVIVSWIASSITDILTELPHSRFIEEEADLVGLMLAAKACFDIREAPVVWAKMGIMEKDNISIEWLSTHPSHERRQANLEEMLSNAISIRDKCQCPRLPSLDPRLKIEAYKKMFKSQSQQRKETLLVPIKVDTRGL